MTAIRTRTFDVSLSFAGEDRGYVEQIAIKLKTMGLNVFYDQFYSCELWGEDLFELLDDVYRKQSRYVIIFASSNYAGKLWTTHERRSAQARVLLERQDAYLLPVVWMTLKYPDLGLRLLSSMPESWE